jgi:hypothetical protein
MLETEVELVKYYLGIIFILMLTACNGKKFSDLQEKVTTLETLVISVSLQHDTLKQKLSNLQTQLKNLGNESSQVETP